MIGEALLTLRAVTKCFSAFGPDVRALRGVDLEVAEGDFVALTGPAGSGKSTCLNVLGSIITPTAGSYCFRGIDVGALDAGQRASFRRYFVGFVLPGSHLLAKASVLENVALPLLVRGVHAAERRERAREALAAVDFEGDCSRVAGELSTTDRQRAALARAIVGEPLVLLADEPAPLASCASRMDLARLLARLNRTRGIAVVMAIREPGAAAYARRTVTFREGLVEAPAEPTERAA